MIKDKRILKCLNTIKNLNSLLLLRGDKGFKFYSYEEYTTMWWTKYWKEQSEKAYLLYILNQISMFLDIEITSINHNKTKMDMVYRGYMISYKFTMTFDEFIEFLIKHERQSWRYFAYHDLIVEKGFVSEKI